MDLGLSGKTAVVTGASSGIGLACAQLLLQEGARVMITGRGTRVLETAARLEEQHPGRAAGLVADLAQPDVGERVARELAGRWGAPDIVLCSGGGPASSSVLDTPDEQWREAFESVFLGPLRVIRAVAPSMTAGGAIGLVLSSSVYSPIANLALSNGIRPGLAMAAKTLSDELAPRGIRVVGLIPGRIATERTLDVDRASPEVSARRNSAIPLGRLGTAEEFAAVAVFAMSPVASYLTGTNVVVDGGALRRV